MPKDDEVYCPTCNAMVPLAEDGATRVEFAYTSVTVNSDGSIDLGYRDDVFLDYWHMTCGTKVRFTSNAIWNGQEYGPDPDPMVEIDPGEGPIVPGVYDGEVTNVSATKVWQWSLNAMFKVYDQARALSEERYK